MRKPQSTSDVVDARNARRAVAILLDTYPPELVATAELLTSEVVSNATRHGGRVAGFALRLSDDVFRVEVTDESPQQPAVLDVGWESPEGRGMFIVNEMASRWTVLRVETGKIVAFELDLGLQNLVESDQSEKPNDE